MANLLGLYVTPFNLLIGHARICQTNAFGVTDNMLNRVLNRCYDTFMPLEKWRPMENVIDTYEWEEKEREMRDDIMWGSLDDGSEEGVKELR